MSGSSLSSLRFGPSARLRQSYSFARIKTTGKRTTSGCLIVNWSEREPEESSRLGVVTPKRIGSAVDRSRARRLMRESFRQHRNDLMRPVDLVLVARKSMTGMKLKDVEKDLLLALKRGNILKGPE